MAPAPTLTRSAARLLLTASLVGLTDVHAPGQEILRDVEDPLEEEEAVAQFHLPYGFYSANFDLALGYFYSVTGFLQDQLTIFGTAFASTNGSIGTILGFADAQIPKHPRWTYDGYLSLGHFGKLRAYTDGNPDYPGSRAGSNDSDPNDFIEDVASEFWFDFPFRYLLPLGDGEERAIHTYYLDRGMLVDGATNSGFWNPLESGRTFAGVTPFYRRQEFDVAPDTGLLATNGLAFTLEYDNRDFNRNPSSGSRQKLIVARDFGAADSSDQWTNVAFEFSKHFPLPTGRRTRQRVLSLDFWTSDTLTWEETATPDGVEITGAPPYFAGSTLGGLRNLRAYPTDRFNDQAAIYYALEYRVTPNWQPVARRRERLMKPLEIDFWQWVLFAEAGRVAPAWSPSELHSDMKWDVGISLRFMAHKQIVRFDLAGGPEGVAFLVDFRQPF